MDTYCEKQGISPNSTRFMFEDKRLNPMQTAEQVMITMSCCQIGMLLTTLLGRP